MNFHTLALFLLFITACSHYRSGKYLKIDSRSDIEKILKEYNVSEGTLISLNGQLVLGSWVFVPTSDGIINKNSSPRLNSRMSILKNEFLWPVPLINKISSKFGKRWGRDHEGIDIAAPRGTHFLASKDGKVIYSGDSLKTYGNMVIINHGDGSHTVYAHAMKLFVRKGQRVSKGEVIGKVGSTGRSSGPHLHFEIRRNKVPINPESYLVFN